MTLKHVFFPGLMTYCAVKNHGYILHEQLAGRVGKDFMKSTSFPCLERNKRQKKTLSTNDRQSKTLSTQIIYLGSFCSSAKLCLGQQFSRNTVARSYC